MKEVNLITVAVTTYNASQFITETLESIYSQSYSNLALIISDDYSSDSTVSIINNWVSQEKNKKRFSTIDILTVSKNTGVSANCNRCLKAIKSEWFKFISGDDVLLPNCIQDNVNFVFKNSLAKIIFSQVKLYENNFQEQNYIKTLPHDYPNNLMGESLTANDQYNLLLQSDRVNYTPSFFSNKNALLAVGGYDESNRLVEDYLMWLNLTKSGERLYYFHKETVGYRMHSKATNNNGQDVLFKPSVINNYFIRKKHAHPHLPWLDVKIEHHVYRVSIFFKKIGLTEPTTFNKFLYALFTVYANPYIYLNVIYKMINKI